MDIVGFLALTVGSCLVLFSSMAMFISIANLGGKREEKAIAVVLLAIAILGFYVLFLELQKGIL